VRYAVLSDIHGNLEALEAWLADAATRTDALLCLGDLVGYGADPVACVEMVAGAPRRSRTVITSRRCRGLDLDWFNPTRAPRPNGRASDWTTIT